MAAASLATTPEQTIAALSSAAQKLTAIQHEVSATSNEVSETLQVAGEILHGGRPAPMLSMLDRIYRAVLAVAQHCDSANQHVTAAISEAERLGTSSGASGDTSSSAVPDSSRPEQRWAGYPPDQTLSWSDRRHIVYGDEDDLTSGGHLHGLNRPNKTEFPPDWDEEKIAREVTDVAAKPQRAMALPDGKWLVVGVRDGVTVNLYVYPDGRIAAGFPVSGPGVKKNPPNGAT